MAQYHNKKAAEIIKKFVCITLATSSSDGQPWNTPLSCVYDKDIAYYSNSDKNTIHAKNIRENDKVFWVIYNSTVGNNETDSDGLYFQGRAYEVDNKEEIMNYRNIKLSKKGVVATDEEYSKFSGNSNRRVYKFVSEKVWINDVEFDANGKYVRDVRVEIPLDDLKKLV